MLAFVARVSALLVALIVGITLGAPNVSAAEEQSPWNHCYYAGSGTSCADIIGNTVHINCNPSPSEATEGVKSIWWATVWCSGSEEL